MDLRRFVDLYNSEAQEHLRLLQRSLLALEQDRTGGVLDEAFRAAHTLKGISAAMGYSNVAAAAHQLEDRLAGVRSSGSRALPGLIDELLQDADAVAAAVEAAATSGDLPESPSTTGADAEPQVPATTEPLAIPAGTATVAHVQLRPDAPIKAARALLIMKALEGRRGLIGSEPSTFGEEFNGRLHVFFGADADLGGAEGVLRAAGDVETVELRPVTVARPAPSLRAPGAERATISGRAKHVRLDAKRLDELAEGVGELSALLSGVRLESLPPDTVETLDRISVRLGTLQQDVLQLRMVPLREAFERLPRVVRDAARAVGREVDLSVRGEDVQLDRAIVEELGDPLVHLLRNAVDHGIEPSAVRVQAGKPARGRIEIGAQRERSSVLIVLADDGGGIAAEQVLERARAAGIAAPASAEALSADQLLSLLSHPGLSTAERVTSVSGRGVGLDVVVSRVRALGGAIDMQTSRGEGTTFSIRLPITLALAPALRVRVGAENYFIPLTHVSEAVDLQGAIEADDTVWVRGSRIPLVRLGRVLHVAEGASEDTAIIAGVGERRVALGIDELVGREQVLVKSFDAVPGLLPHFAGTAFLPAGEPALVLDPLSLIGGQ